jgi:hypothetical protein
MEYYKLNNSNMTDLEEKIIESYDAIQKVNDKAKAGKFKTTEDYKKAIDKVLAKYDPYLKELNKKLGIVKHLI